jgi:hypothetical protein
MEDLLSDYTDLPQQEFHKDRKRLHSHEATNTVHVVGSHELPAFSREADPKRAESAIPA